MTTPHAICTYFLRTLDVEGDHYERIHLSTSPTSDGSIPLPIPPAIGDLVALQDDDECYTTTTYRVMDRIWSPPMAGVDTPSELSIIVEPAEAPDLLET